MCYASPVASYVGSLTSQANRILSRSGAGKLVTETWSYDGEWRNDLPNGKGVLNLFGTAVPVTLSGQWMDGVLHGHCEVRAPSTETSWYQEPRGPHLLDARLVGDCVGGYLQGDVSFVIPSQATGRDRQASVKVAWEGSLQNGLVQGDSTLRLVYPSTQEVVYDMCGSSRTKDSYRIVTEYNGTALRRDEEEMAAYLGESLPEEERVRIGTTYGLYCRMDLCYFDEDGRFVDAGELGIAVSDDEYLLQNALGSLLEFLRLARFHSPTALLELYDQWSLSKA